MTDDLLRQSRLGQPSDYPERYAPDVLFAIPRAESRRPLGIDAELPFRGEDIWNAWELTWLDPAGKPRIATATLRVAANSANLIESKSLKLYLAGFAHARYASTDELADVIGSDLTRVTGCRVDVELCTPEAFAGQSIATFPGRLIDTLDVACDARHVDPGVLRTVDESAEESLHTHLLRSLCPVTGQPDTGSLMVAYRGPAIDPASLLQYVISFRAHNDFHEACVERMFVDLMAHCRCEALSVYARYNRRGGIDINPFRSNVASTAENLRLWRQ